MRKEIIYYGTLDSFEGNTSNNIHNPCTKAMDKNTHPDILDVLSNNPDEYVKYLVASNPSAYPHTLERLVKCNQSSAIIVAVAGNPSTTIETLRIIADTTKFHKDRLIIFEAIESNPNYKAKQLKTKVLYETDPSKLGDLEFIEWLKIASLEQLEDFAFRDYEQHESLWERFSNWCVFSLFS